MTVMVCALIAVTIVSLMSGAAFQVTGTLRVKVVLTDASQKATPVPRHTLLISQNPVSAPPRRVVTGVDGTVDVKLRPGNYTVESDTPVTFLGNAYQWTQTIDVAADRETVLELTAGNAEVEPSAALPSNAAAPPDTDPRFMETQWRNSIVSVWTPTLHASGFVIDAKGLIATNARGLGGATVVEVQVGAAVKVAASILATDAARDVAILWIDPKAITGLPPIPLGCGQLEKAAAVERQEIFTIGVSFRQQKRLSSGVVTRLRPDALLSDLMLARGSEGGPVFTAAGRFVGITALLDEEQATTRDEIAVVRAAHVCGAVLTAERKMLSTMPPDGMHRPVDPERPYTVSALEEAASRPTGSTGVLRTSSSSFDITFITPIPLYASQHQRTTRTRPGDAGLVDPLTDFSNWSDYVLDFPPVLFVRVTPRLAEGFWTMVARGAARTQGVSIPPIKRIKPGFSRLRALCGSAEVIPIHPFKLEQRVSESDGIFEGLYVFEPGALRPECGTVKLELYSEKEPTRAEVKVVDVKLLQQLWEELAPWR